MFLVDYFTKKNINKQELNKDRLDVNKQEQINFDLKKDVKRISPFETDTNSFSFNDTIYDQKILEETKKILEEKKRLSDERKRLSEERQKLSEERRKLSGAGGLSSALPSGSNLEERSIEDRSFERANTSRSDLESNLSFKTNETFKTNESNKTSNSKSSQLRKIPPQLRYANVTNKRTSLDGDLHKKYFDNIVESEFKKKEQYTSEQHEGWCPIFTDSNIYKK